MPYSAEGLKKYPLWASENAGIYILKRGEDKYDVTLYTIRDGGWEPTNTAAFVNTLWVLNIIRCCKLKNLDGTIKFIPRER